MDGRRRDFLKTAGLTVLGAGCCGPAASASARSETQGAQKSRWAMVVDTAKCASKKDCAACMTACHRAHNVPALENKSHKIEWIWKEAYGHVFADKVHPYMESDAVRKPVVVLCNHCDNPPCVRVCPTQATWKRPDGIVMMDQHRCIGCRYCVVACPYSSRSFNWRDPRPFIAKITPDYPTRTRGVVEKCNFCAERLAEGLPPLCVEACAKAGVEALTFGDLADPDSEIARLVRTRDVERRRPTLGTSPHVFYLT